MIALCTGTSGSGQIEYLERMAAEIENEQDRPRVYDLGEIMHDLAAEQKLSIPEEKLVDVGIVQELLSGWALERIGTEIRSHPEVPVHVVVAHACFRRRNVLFMGFDVECVQRLRPDVVITIIDDISQVEGRLKCSKTWAKWCQPRDLSCWREEEILVSSVLARYQAVEYYVVPQAEPPITLYNLLYKRDMKKVYLSFPISNIMKLEDQEKRESFLGEVERLRDNLRKDLVVFDPLSIKDLQLMSEDLEESEAKALAGQTVVRDYMLIDQSDFVVGYYPVAERSLGVAAEMRYATQSGKSVHAVIDEGSPFLSEFVDHPYDSPEDLIAALRAEVTKGDQS